MRIVLNEYPKSGGSWVVSMLGDALTLPKRDIYVSDGYDAFNVKKHPWYLEANSLNVTDTSIIKSHEWPDSALIAFPAKQVHLLRDGRDVVISKYYFEKDFCVANGIYDHFDEPFEEYLPRVAAEWKSFVLAWLEAGIPYYTYEDFLSDANASLKKMIVNLGFAPEQTSIQKAVFDNNKENFRKQLDITFEHNTFVRKASSGDWRNHFSSNHVDIFKSIAGDLLIQLGYEDSMHWG